MVERVNFQRFVDRFREMGRLTQFSYLGLRALYTYLEELENDTGQPWELDVIALCCDYSEFDSFRELQNEYPEIEDMESLRDHTQVIPVSDEGFIIQAF